MSRTLKRTLSVVLVALMMLSLTAAAFADGEGSTDSSAAQTESGTPVGTETSGSEETKGETGNEPTEGEAGIEETKDETDNKSETSDGTETETKDKDETKGESTNTEETKSEAAAAFEAAVKAITLPESEEDLTDDVKADLNSKLEAAYNLYDALSDEEKTSVADAKATLDSINEKLNPTDAANETVYVAYVGSTGEKYETLAEAIAATAENDTVTILIPGTYSVYKQDIGQVTGKSLTFVGTGTSSTTWIVGAEVPREGYVGEYDSDYSFQDCNSLTFKNMTLQYGSKYFLGFSHVGNFNVDSCVVNGQVTYGGKYTATYTNTVFNAPGADYSLWSVEPDQSITFSGCTFNCAGKVLNIYKHYKKEVGGTITVNFSNCTVNSSAANKTVLNIKDGSEGKADWVINFSGTNTVTGLNSDSTTCSKLFMVNQVGAEGGPYFTTVNIDGTTVWQKGAMVAHAIDCTNDKYTDGYKYNDFTTTYSEWQTDPETQEVFRTYKKTCNICGYSEEGKEYKLSLSFDANGGTGTMANQAGAAGEKITLTTNSFTKENCKFIGWNTAKDGTGTAYADGADFTFGTDDVTLYAQWEQLYTVTYTDGNHGKTFKDQVYTGLSKGDATPGFVGNITRWGYTFTGWSPAVTDTVTGSVTYTACWKYTGIWPYDPSKGPQTGDDSNLALWAVLMLTAGAAAAGTVIYGKKKQSGK